MARINNGGVVGKQITQPNAASASGKWNIAEQSLYKINENWPEPQVVFPPSDYYAYWRMTLSNNSISSVGTRTASSSATNVSSVDGVYGGFACSFNGTSSYIDLGFSDNFTSEMTWAFWIYPIAAGGEVISKISYFAASTVDFPFTIFLSTSNINAQISYGNDYSTDGVATANITYNQWNHVAVTYKSSSSIKIFVNGVLGQQVTINNSISSNSRNWVLGRSSFPYSGGSPGRFLNGYLDEVYLYNRELTSTEIQTFRI